MSTERKPGPKDAPLSEEVVRDYLLAHPDFFEKNQDFVARLKIPHQAGPAVSLIERQVQLLRQQNRQLERKLVDLIEVARANDSLLERIHYLAVSLLQAPILEERLIALQEALRTRFGADEVSLVLFQGDATALDGTPARKLKRQDQGLQGLSKFLENGKPQCGRLQSEQLRFLFGPRAERIGSAALVPLGHHADLGILAIGSRHTDHFSPTLGTAFLSRIGELVSHALQPLLYG